MKNFEAFPARFPRLRKRIWFRFGEPTCQIKRRCRRERANPDKIVAYHLSKKIQGMLFKLFQSKISIDRPITCPSKPAVSAFASTCVIILPDPRAPTVVEQFAMPTALHKAVRAAGPSSGAAKEIILMNPRAAWHAAHVSLMKGEFTVLGRSRRLICLIAAFSREFGETASGRGNGSTVSA